MPPLVIIAVLAAQAPSGETYSYPAAGYPSFGMIVGQAGDVDGEGIPEIVLGDPGHPGQVQAAFWIVSGKDGSVLHRIVLPEEKSSRFVLDGGVDIDGDSVPDLLIGAHALRKEEKDAGQVYLASGKTGSVLRRMAVSGVWGGDWARFISDADHDGIADVGVLDLDSSTKGALLSIYSGRSGAPIADLPLENECGTSNGGFVEAGDVDGDGTSDVAVVLDGCKQSPASVRMYSGAKKTILWQHSGRLCCGAFAMLCVVGDLDHDGVRELAVSFFDEVHVVSGKTGIPRFRFEPDGESDSERGYGWALAPLGDIDRDGVADLAFSETEAGTWCGSIHAVSGKDGVDLWESKGCWGGDVYHFGCQLAALGDVDGDSISDLVAGIWKGPSGERGLARVISGKNGRLIFELTRKGADVVVSRRSGLVPSPR